MKHSNSFRYNLGEGGISLNITINDMGGRGTKMTYDGDGMNKKVKDGKNVKNIPLNSKKNLESWANPRKDFSLVKKSLSLDLK